MAVGRCQLGLVISWQCNTDGTANLESNLAISIWRRDDQTQTACNIVRAKMELLNRNKTCTREAKAGDNDDWNFRGRGSFTGWWLNDVTIGQLLDQSNGWLHDNRLHVLCEISAELQTLEVSFTAGDSVRVKNSVSTPKYKWGNVRPGMRGVVLQVENKERMRIDFRSHLAWLAHPSEIELCHAREKLKGLGFQSALQEMLDSKELADLAIETAGGDVIAHSAVVAAASVVFRRMLVAPMMEGLTRRINLQYLSKQVVEKLIAFMYEGDVAPELLCDEALVLDLLHAAGQFELPGLVRRCVEALASDLNFENVVERFRVARIFGDVGFQSCCIAFIGTHMREIQATNSWHSLLAEMPSISHTFEKYKILAPLGQDLRALIQEVVEPSSRPGDGDGNFSRQVSARFMRAEGQSHRYGKVPVMRRLRRKTPYELVVRGTQALGSASV